MQSELNIWSFLGAQRKLEEILKALLMIEYIKLLSESAQHLRSRCTDWSRKERQLFWELQVSPLRSHQLSESKRSKYNVHWSFKKSCLSFLFQSVKALPKYFKEFLLCEVCNTVVKLERKGFVLLCQIRKIMSLVWYYQGFRAKEKKRHFFDTRSFMLLSQQSFSREWSYRRWTDGFVYTQCNDFIT